MKRGRFYHERPLVCTHEGCHKTFKHARNLQAHALSHSLAAFPCPHEGCQVSCSTRSNLTRHVRLIHQVVPGTPSHACESPGCSALLRSHRLLVRHVREEHGVTLTLACAVAGCASTFRYASQLRKHMASHAGTGAPQVPPGTATSSHGPVRTTHPGSCADSAVPLDPGRVGALGEHPGGRAWTTPQGSNPRQGSPHATPRRDALGSPVLDRRALPDATTSFLGVSDPMASLDNYSVWHHPSHAAESREPHPRARKQRALASAAPPRPAPDAAGSHGVGHNEMASHSLLCVRPLGSDASTVCGTGGAASQGGGAHESASVHPQHVVAAQRHRRKGSRERGEEACEERSDAPGQSSLWTGDGYAQGDGHACQHSDFYSGSVNNNHGNTGMDPGSHVLDPCSNGHDPDHPHRSHRPSSSMADSIHPVDASVRGGPPVHPGGVARWGPSTRGPRARGCATAALGANNGGPTPVVQALPWESTLSDERPPSQSLAAGITPRAAATDDVGVDGMMATVTTTAATTMAMALAVVSSPPGSRLAQGRARRGAEVGLRTRFACHVAGCQRSFSSKSNLGMHVRTVHQQLRRFACRLPACGRAFAHRHTACLHERSQHGLCLDDHSEHIDDWLRARKTRHKRAPTVKERLLR
eukprot:jgi/Mesvir1/12015/Mv00315-RA.3